MVRKIVFAMITLAAGVAVAMYFTGSHDTKPAQTFSPRTDASETERIADLERALAAQVDRANLLETRLGELESRMGARGDRERGMPGSGNDPRADRREEMRQRFGDANGNFDPATMRERMREMQLERLEKAGFSRQRAEWIERRTQELQLQAQQAQYDAQRSGQPYRGVDIEAALRKEMGDSEYEKYLSATGRPTNVRVMDVLASSAAEKSGLQAGDQIVSYAGTRVFDMNELSTLTRQGTPGESVTVEVQRDGQTIQMQVPRGVLGVQSGGRGGPPGGFGGGPPGGGFRGGPPGGG